MSNISLLPATPPAELTAIPAPARGVFRRRIARRIIVALAAAFSFAAPAGACQLVCLITGYTLTGAADTPAARETACNAAKAGFKPPLLGMIQSLAGDTAFFSSAKGGVTCAAATTAPAAFAAATVRAMTYNQVAVSAGHSHPYNDAAALYSYLISVIGYTADQSAKYLIEHIYKPNIAAAYKAAFLAGFIGNAPASAADAAWNAYKTAFEAKYYYLTTGCTGSTADCEARIALMHKDINDTPIVNAAIAACQAAQDASGHLVCCNM